MYCPRQVLVLVLPVAWDRFRKLVTAESKILHNTSLLICVRKTILFEMSLMWILKN